MPMGGTSGATRGRGRRGAPPARRRRGGRAIGLGLVSLPALLLSACGPGGGSGETPAAVPMSSVLLVTIDTWRADALGAGGDPRIKTPYLDRLFRRNLQFAQTWSPVPTTLASHTSLLSGAWPTNHGVPANLWPVPEDVLTLPEILSERGFATAAFVSSAALDSEFGLDQGFDKYNFKAIAYEQSDAPWRPAFRTLFRAKTWWDETTGPKFLWVHLWEAHFPYEPVPALARAYDPDYTGTADGSMAQLTRLWRDPDPPPEADRRHIIALYHAEVTGIDRVLGGFLDEIDTSATVVVVTGDHGESLGEHNLSFKHGPHVFAGDVRVPLVVAAPGYGPKVSGAQVRTIDVPRTLLRLLGLDDSMLPEESADLLEWADGGAGLPVFTVATQPWEEIDDDVYPNTSLQRGLHLPDAAYVETPFLDRSAWFDRTRDPGELFPVPFPGDGRPDSLRSALDRWIGAARYRPDYRPVEQENLREQLRSLGYVD